jgi:hypothetical protein
MQNGYQKTQNFMLTSNPLKKLQKNSDKQCYQQKSDRKIKILTFIIVCISVRTITFTG